MIDTKLYISPSQDPFTNLALEDWALKHLDTANQDYLILYVNRPCAVIGRNQNIFQELNLTYCLENKIEVTRRISGGGTVFHDEGNLNWAFITSFDFKKVNNYTWAAQPIIELLKTYRLSAYLTDRNAIEVDGLKLSGQAQFTNRKNILSHGTLLVNADLKRLQAAIEPHPLLQIKSKASPSVRSKTTNLAALLNDDTTVIDVINRFKESTYLDTIDKLNETLDVAKFKAYDWIYERSPKFTAIHEIEGELHTLVVEKARIKAIKNKEGHLLQDNPLLNQTYEKFLAN